MEKILIIEDDELIAELERDYLEANGYETDLAFDGITGEQKAKTEKYDAILLDVMLPGKTGFDVCRELRKNLRLPIIMVTAKKEDIDKIRGLGLGADDYLEKPVDIDILCMKIAALMKRCYEEPVSGNVIVSGDIEIHQDTMTVFHKGNPLALTIKEYDLLLMLVENKGKTLDKNRIFNSIWGPESDSEPQTLTVHIKMLRDKIEEDSKNPRKIKTVWGVGYRYEEI